MSQEARDVCNHESDRVRGQRHRASSDVNPETDDFERGAMLLLLVVVRTRDVVPEDEELDLMMRPLLHGGPERLTARQPS